MKPILLPVGESPQDKKSSCMDELSSWRYHWYLAYLLVVCGAVFEGYVDDMWIFKGSMRAVKRAGICIGECQRS